MSQASEKAFVTALLVLTLSGVYCSNLRLIAAGDSLPTALVSLSLAVDRTVTLDRFGPWLDTNVPWSRGLVVFSNGHYHSVYPVGQAALAAPLFAPAAAMLGVRTWEVPRQVYFARVVEKIAAAVMTAITVAVMFLALGLVVPPGWVWGMTAVFALGTSSWTISGQALWQQTGGQLCIAFAFYCFIRWLRQEGNIRWLLLVGLCCAMAGFVRPTNATFAAAFAFPVVLWHRTAKAIATLLCLPLVGACILAAYNLHIFGSVIGGYGQYLSPNKHALIALAGILVSPGRGLFVFSPVLVFAVPGMLQRSVWRPPKRSLALACVGAIGSHLLVISYWRMWWGGFSWGSRLLTEIGPAMILLAGFAIPVITKHALLKTVFGISALASVCIQAIGVFCYPGGGWDSSPYPVDALRVWDWEDNPISRCVRAGIDRVPYQSAHRLLEAETWTVANSWRAISPMDLATARWWGFPDAPLNAIPDTTKLHSLPRRQSTSCYIDTLTLKRTEDPVRLSLHVVGWAFDSKSGTAPALVLIETASPVPRSRMFPAQRLDRPDVAKTFKNDRLLSSGFWAELVLDQPASTDVRILVLQLAPDGLVECVPPQPSAAEN